MSMFLARFRGRNLSGGSQQLHIECPPRLNQTFYNYARAHAVMHGRSSITKDDLRLILRITVDSVPDDRQVLCRALIHAGELSTNDVMDLLHCSNPTALEKMKDLCLLGICKRYSKPTEKQHRIGFIDEFQWFTTDECRVLMAGERSPEPRDGISKSP